MRVVREFIDRLGILENIFIAFLCKGRSSVVPKMILVTTQMTCIDSVTTLNLLCSSCCVLYMDFNSKYKY